MELDFRLQIQQHSPCLIWKMVILNQTNYVKVYMNITWTQYIIWQCSCYHLLLIIQEFFVIRQEFKRTHYVFFVYRAIFPIYLSTFSCICDFFAFLYSASKKEWPKNFVFASATFIHKTLRLQFQLIHSFITKLRGQEN